MYYGTYRWAQVDLQAPLLQRRVFVLTWPIYIQRLLAAVNLEPLLIPTVRFQRCLAQTRKPTTILPTDVRVRRGGLRVDLTADKANETAHLVVVVHRCELSQHLSVLRQSYRGDLIPLDERDCIAVPSRRH